MNGRTLTIVMILAALLAAGAAAYVANRYIERSINERTTEMKRQYEPVSVIVANMDLAPGTPLTAKTASLREIPKAYLSSDAMPADAWSSVNGRVVSLPVRSGEPILTAHLAQEIGAGFSAELPQGQRALTFPVNDESSIAQLLQPGDRIDLFFTTTSGNDSVTVPLLYSVPVLATGVRTLANERQVGDTIRRNGYNTVTVAVTPENAAKITLAQQSGKVTVTLRQRQDENVVRVPRVNKATLLALNPTVARRGIRPVEIILGRQ